MATTRIPSSQGIRQLNIDDTSGEIWATKNIDLRTNPSKIKLARPMKQVMTDAELGVDPVEAIEVFEDDVFALTDKTLFKSNLSNLNDLETWTTATESPNNSEDLAVFNSQIAIVDRTDIDAWDGSTYTTGWWTSRGNPALNTNKPHILEVVNIGAETLAVTDGSQVHAYTGGIASGAVTSVTVDLPSSATATCLRSGIRRVFIGTSTESTLEAFVYEWDGASTNTTQAFPTGAQAVLAMEMIDNAPMIITERGEIKLFNNAGFTRVAQFPFTDKFVYDTNVRAGSVATGIGAPVHPKGMKRSGDNLYINVNFQTSLGAAGTAYTLDERSPNGLWVLNLKTYSLSHLCSPNNEIGFKQVSPLMILQNFNSRILMGSRQTDNEYSLWAEEEDPTVSNEGYLITPEINSNTVKDVYKEIVAQAFMETGDTLQVKYRSINVSNYPITNINGTWSETTQFNTTDDFSEVYTRFTAGELDEMEVLIGSGAGKSVQITNIEQTASTYVVTVDQDCGIIGETSIIRIDNWEKIDKTMTVDNKEIARFGTGSTGSWGQFKLIIKGKKGLPEIRQMLIKTNAKEEL
jgi:hypothetical protein